MKLPALLIALATLGAALSAAAQTGNAEEARPAPAQAAAPAPAQPPAAAPAASPAPANGAATETPEAQQLQVYIDPAEAEQQKRIMAAEAKRKAAIEKQRAWEARCQIKPVMSDREIEICREVATRRMP